MHQRIALSIAVLAGAVVGGVAIGGLNAQSPGPSSQPLAQSSQSSQAQNRSRIFVITEQEITNEQRYNTEYAPKVTKTILDHQGQFIVRTNQITNLQGDPGPKRIVILGFDSMDQVQRWQNSADYKDLAPIRGQVMKLKQFAVQTCQSGGGTGGQPAQPGQPLSATACPNN